mgnify:CR=1 FL=1
MTKNTLYLFTASFPYGTKSETFLETEIVYLAKEFDRIVIIPAIKDSEYMRDLPVNASVNTCIIATKASSGKLLFFKHFFKIVYIMTYMMLTNRHNRLLYLKNFKYYLARLIGELDYFERIKPHVSKLNKDKVIFYSYWFEYCLLALCMLKKNGLIKHVISRTHRFDLYDEENSNRPIPFREYKLLHADYIFCISKQGQIYLKSKVDKEFHPKILLSYLGVPKPNSLPKKTPNSISVIVSVANLIPLKRIDLIIEVLKGYTQPLRWFHFGSGPMLETLQQSLSQLPENIEAKLMGQFSNEEILNFYSTNYVHLFISLSRSEGLPVSMMEAQSFGIPILACDVGGVSEIVSDGVTGVLIDQHAKPQHVATLIQSTLHTDFDRSEIRQFFHNNFCAQNNYLAFSRRISKLVD